MQAETRSTSCLTLIITEVDNGFHQQVAPIEIASWWGGLMVEDTQYTVRPVCFGRRPTFTKIRQLLVGRRGETPLVPPCI